MASFNPDVIKEFADNLYARARGVIAAYTIGGFVIVGAAAFFVAVYISTNAEALPWIGGLMGGVLGFFSGRSKAFELKLKAQRALTQLRIAENTSKLNTKFTRIADEPDD